MQFSGALAAKVYSIGLAVMVKNEFEPSFSTEGARQDLTALRATVKAILDASYFKKEEEKKYRVRVHLPVEPWRDIFDGSGVDTGTQFHNKLNHLKEQLERAEASDDEREQCEILNKLFGDDFEVPDPPTTKSKATKAVYATPGLVGHSQGA